MLTVITPNANRNLTTLATVKAEIGTTTVPDAEISKYIAQASDIIADYCNRIFCIETVKETWQGRGYRSTLMLSRYPVVEVVSVMDGDRIVTADQFQIDLPTGIILGLSACAGATAITYSAGFTLPEGLPRGIERACIDMVSQYVSVAGSDRDPAIRSMTIDGVGSREYFNTNTSATITSDIEGLIAPHRKPNC